jgi:uncharacterized protein (DUF58 family)
MTPVTPEPLAIGPLLDALRGVTWPARALVRAGLPGAHRANQRGTSGEFTEYRGYRQGDDPRRIDWRLLARSDRAFVRVTDERAWWPTWLVLDASASMAFPAPGASWARGAGTDKWTMARALTAGLAAAAHATGDPVGVIIATRPDARRLPPRTRRGTVQAIARALDEITPRGDVPLAPLLARVPAGARLVVITDALTDDEGLLSAMARRRAAGSDATLVQVVHPCEVDPPAGAWQAIDPEAEHAPRPLVADARARYRDAFAAWRASVARRALATGARHVTVLCDESPPRAVRRIVQGVAPVASAPTASRSTR